MSSSSPLSALSTDTKNHVLNFLSLTDCLNYGQTSTQALQEIHPNIEQRREKQFGDRHAYQLNNPDRLVPVKDIPSLLSEDQHDFVLAHGGEEQWHVLPSVAERLEGLYRALPQSHSGKDQARELLLEVQKETSDDVESNNMQSAISKLHSLLKAHKLHDLLLTRSTLLCRPPPVQTAHHNNDLTITVTLGQYMGDVLIANYLMAHSIAGLVEGPTTYSQWTELLTTEMEQEFTATPVQGYRQWIYMHSTVLRTLPMKPEWLEQMKLEPICGIRGHVTAALEEEPVALIRAPPPFLATTETVQALKVLAGPMRRNHWTHSTRLDDFGPLGPAFRGRDRVRTRVMNPGSVLRHLGMFTTLYHSRCTPSGGIFSASTLLDIWLRGSEAETSWLLNLSKECYRNRPMTVQPPLVTISPRWE